MKKNLIIIGVISVIVIGSMAWTLVKNKKTVDSRREVQTATMNIAVTVAPAEMKAIGGNLNLVGTAEANRMVTVASEVSGSVTGVNFKLGDYVSEGAILAQVDDEYKLLLLKTAQLNYDKYKEDYERYLVLREGDAVTETQLRDMKLAYENASVQLENAKKQVKDTRIVAPYSGHITSKNVETGTHVNIGSAIAGIVDISQLRVVLSISESNVYALRKGQQVSITTPVYPKANYSGTISNISPQGDNAHTYPVEIIISNSKEYPLKAGTYVHVKIDMGQSAPALMIPREALVGSIKEPSVYVITGNVAKLVRITTGNDAGGYLEVLSGLNENDLIVTNGQINLIDGATVSITKQ